MIGLKFLMTFFTAAMYFAVAMALVLLFFFVVTWAIRLLVEGFRIGLSDHWKWFRGYLPRRKAKPERELTLALVSPIDHKLIQLISEDDRDFWEKRGFIVMDPEDIE